MNYKEIDHNAKKRNRNILKQIQIFLDKKQIEKAAQYMGEYIKNNLNNDSFVLLKYAQILRLQTKYDEAIPILEKLLLTDNNKNYALLEIILIYIQKRNYKQALECINQLKLIENNTTQIKSLLFLETFVRKQLYGEIDNEIECHSLNIKYNESQAIGHTIKTHCFDTHLEGKGYFGQKINIEDLFYKVKKMIEENNLKFYCASNSICYYFHYKNIGYDKDNQNTSVFAVIVNPLCGIITMYPVNDNIDKCMLNKFEIEEEIYDIKTPKRKSQIEKFNQRYNL